MNSKPTPLYEQPVRKRCPICGEKSYSADGVHPQCRVAEADSLRMEKVKAARKAEEKPVIPTTTLARWQRKCPKCDAVGHVRKQTCDCGHRLIPHQH